MERFFIHSVNNGNKEKQNRDNLIVAQNAEFKSTTLQLFAKLMSLFRSVARLSSVGRRGVPFHCGGVWAPLQKMLE